VYILSFNDPQGPTKFLFWQLASAVTLVLLLVNFVLLCARQINHSIILLCTSGTALLI
jgi:hypothetical protein